MKKLKKVGIITIHDSINCGALLQAYALQETIKSLNCNVEFIDHNRFSTNKLSTEKRIKSSKKTKKNKSIKLAITKVRGYFFARKDNKLKIEACEKFKSKFLNIGARKYTEVDEINEDYPIYDAYVCGSDQIWNPERFDYSAPFFLSFAPEDKLKISYAPSLGVNDIPKQLHEGYKKLINRLDYVSVREENGAKLIGDIVDKNVECVLDPTFLISKEKWEKVASNDDYLNEKYIFCYFLNYMSAYTIRKQLNEYAKQNNLKILMFHPKCSAIDKHWIPAYGLGPSEFLNAIKSANLVITDSFHGTTLSIILEKDFFVYSAESKLPFASRFGRIGNVLKKADLNGRTLDINDKIYNKNIEYRKVKQKLEPEIIKSIKYLEDALNCNKCIDNSEENNFELPYNQRKCVGCGLCSSICKYDAIHMEIDSEGFYRPKWNKDKCVGCNACVKLCPAINNIQNETKENNLAFSAWNKDSEIQKNSSSGGIFSVLAETIINSGGLVIGAMIDNSLKVKHVAVSSINELDKCRGSKYIQSELNNDIYDKISKAIKENKKVLFTGTGCQCAAIKSRFNSKNVYLCDVVCHGIGSPGIFKEYIKSAEEKNNNTIKNYTFRDESLGWNKPCVKIEYEDGKTDRHRWYKDEYIQAFSKNLVLRSSCYECQYSKFPRISDITIADFWGARKVKAKYNSKGTSLVIINSEKGMKLFKDCEKKIEFAPVNLYDALKYNKSATSSVKKPALRDSLFYYYNKNGYNYVRKKYMKVLNFREKVIKNIKGIL